MSRIVLITLRILAVGGALTLLACHVMHEQERAAAAPASAPGAARTPVYMSGTKSLQALDSKARAPEAHFHGTKSGRVLSPQDVTPGIPPDLQRQQQAPQP
jgi:hypothetical protein